MRILMLITGLGVGGAERQLADLADALHRLGHEVAIAYLTGSVRVRPKSPGVVLHDLEADKSVFGLLRVLRRLRSVIGEFRPNVVHSHMFHANILARIARLSVAVPRLVCTAHSTHEGGRLRMLAYRLTHRLADVTTNVSREAVVAFEAKRAIPKGGMLVVPNGIDTTRFCANTINRQATRQQEGIGDDERVVIAVGRLVEAKDFSNLLHAWQEVTWNRTRIKLWIVGDGALRGQLESLAAHLGIEQTVSFLGIRENIPDLLNAVDLFVLSSAWEGFAIVAAEAMACGKVAVVTDAGGTRELLGEVGFLVGVRDSKALAAVLDHALSLPKEELDRLGGLARERVIDHFSLSRAVDKWLDLYAQRAG
ncbi:glycosyltransferase [Ferribacterium limneticum]|uniref:glycosyltransferase n=1 Tax=Ferribacterium limneticum TaxID=76259 RepID=UPI001CFBC150|nr:glycosyltransferase [Ferribacterium limneticum]UCV18278.1 glycosyltransferase [Ferribacterium limneticum]